MTALKAAPAVEGFRRRAAGLQLEGLDGWGHEGWRPAVRKAAWTVRRQQSGESGHFPDVLLRQSRPKLYRCSLNGHINGPWCAHCR